MIPPDNLCRWIIDVSQKVAKQKKEIPVVSAILEVSFDKRGGLVFYENGYYWKIVSLSSNLVKKYNQILFHSEYYAINKIKSKVNKLYLNDYYLISNLEPCLFCYSTLILYRIKTIYFFLYRDKGISSIDIYELSMNRKKNKSKKILNHHIPLIHLEQYSEKQKKIFQNFFQELRNEKSPKVFLNL